MRLFTDKFCNDKNVWNGIETKCTHIESIPDSLKLLHYNMFM